MPEPITASIQCTQCGGHVPVEDDGYVVCPACQSALYVDLSRVCIHQQVEPAIAERDLPGALGRWLHRLEVPGQPRVTKRDLRYWPFWEVEAADARALILAAPSPFTELESIEVPAGRRRRFDDATEAAAVAPTTFGAAALERSGVTGDARLRLLHLPIYHLEYQLDGRRWDALIEGVSGGVFAERLPPPHTTQLDTSHALVFGATFVIFVLEGLLLPDLGPTLLGYGVTGAVLYKVFQARGRR
jgi:hypothetical protein